MRYLKLYENFNYSDIHEICKKYGIENYTINEDGTIDVNGGVDLYNQHYLTKLPLNFRNVSGDFDCSYNRLSSLEGCPKSVGGEFRCNFNKLVSLKECPNLVGTHFYCDENRLTSLEGCPKYITGNLNINNNRLTSLEGCPKSVGGAFNCHDNKLTSLKHCPKYIGGVFKCNYNKIRDFKYFVEPVGFFYSYKNPIYEIWKLFTNKSYIELLNEYDCIRDKDIIIDRLNQFLEEIDKSTVKVVKGYNNI